MLPRDVDKKILVKTMDLYDVIKEKRQSSLESERDYLLKAVDPLEKINDNLNFIKEMDREREEEDQMSGSTPNTATFRLTTAVGTMDNKFNPPVRAGVSFL